MADRLEIVRPEQIKRNYWRPPMWGGDRGWFASSTRRMARGLKEFTMRFVGRGFGGARLMMPRRMNYRKLVNGFESSVVVAPLLWIARTFPEAPLRVGVRNSDGTIQYDPFHAMLERIDSPNNFYTGVEMMMATVIDYSAWGNTYWIKVRGPLNRVVELWWVPQHMMEPRWPDDGSVFISHYEYKPDPTKPGIKIDPRDVVHWRFGSDPENPRKGFSPLGSVLREVWTDDEAAAFTGAVLRNMGVPGVILIPGADSEIEEGDAEGLKSKFRDSFQGENRGDLMVLSANATVQVLSFSPEQMNLQALRRVPEERVSGVLGVPAIVAGLGAGLDRSTFTNMGEAREMGYEGNIIPTQRLFAAKLKKDLLGDFDVNDRARIVDFDTSGIRVLQEDEDKKEARMARRLQTGGVTLAEYRSGIGLPTDETHDVYLRPVSLVEIPMDPADRVDALDVITPAAPKALGPGITPAYAIRELPEGATRPKATAGTIRRGRRHVNRLERERQQHEAHFQKAIAKGLRNLAEDVRSRVEALAAKDGPAPDGLKEPGDPDWPAQLLQMAQGFLSIASLLPPNLGKAFFAATFLAQYANIGDATFAALSDTIGAVVGWNLDDPAIAAFMQKGATQAGLVGVDAQTEAAIMAALADGRSNGDSIDQLAKRIQANVEGCSLYPGICEEKGPDAAAAYRAQVIARSESKTAQNLANVLAMMKSELVTGVLVFDGDGCGWTGHTDPDVADGSTRTLDAAWAQPLAHPQCVRSFAPIVGE